MSIHLKMKHKKLKVQEQTRFTSKERNCFQGSLRTDYLSAYFLIPFVYQLIALLLSLQGRSLPKSDSEGVSKILEEYGLSK